MKITDENPKKKISHSQDQESLHPPKRKSSTTKKIRQPSQVEEQSANETQHFSTQRIHSPAQQAAIKQDAYLISPFFQGVSLDLNTKTQIGRDLHNTIVLPSITISRFHTSVQWENNHFMVRDLGSANGTWVNNRQVNYHALKNHDRITVGDYFCIFRTIKGTSSWEKRGENTHRIDLRHLQKLVHKRNQFLQEKQALRGSFQHIDFIDLLEIIEMDKLSGGLKLFSFFKEARIQFIEGKVIHCQGFYQKAEEGFYQIMQHPWQEFCFDQDSYACEISLSATVEELLAKY